MPRQSVLAWPDGGGSLILSGGTADSGEGGQIEADVLARASAGKALVYIYAGTDADQAEAELERWNDLGSPSGYLLDVLTEDDDTIRAQIADAGLIIVGDGSDVRRLRSAVMGAAAEAIRDTYQTGTIVLGVGIGAQLFGAFLSDGSTGLGWVEDAIILPLRTDTDSDVLNRSLREHPGVLGIGLTIGSALDLRGEGGVNVLGNRQVAIRLPGIVPDPTEGDR